MSKITLFNITKSEAYAIFTGNAIDDIIQFGADELRKYLNKISSIELTITKLPVLESKNALIIAPEYGEPRALPSAVEDAEKLPADGFIIRSDDKLLVLSGSNPRGVIYAVYAFLEELGCRFYAPGDEGEIIPIMNSIPVPKIYKKEKPSFRWREWKEDYRYSHITKDRDHVVTDPGYQQLHEKFHLKLWDWMAKNRINSSKFGDYPKGQTLTARRGIRHYIGGHVIPRLLPRNLHEEFPEYFRMDRSGNRVPNGNFCPSNNNALALVADNAVKLVRANPEAIKFSVIGRDGREGNWCYCPDCRSKTVQDQYIIVCNAIVNAVREAGIEIQVNAMAYNDTIKPDLSVKPDRDLRLTWAPHFRSYGYAHNDMRSELNQWFSDCLAQWTNIFHPEKIDIFEYWHDNIHFRSFPFSCPHVVAQDIRYYHDIGINNHIITCHVGDFSFQSLPLNCYVYVKMIYNIEADVDEIIADYCRHMYGPAAKLMHKWHDEFEEAIHYCAAYSIPLEPPSECSPRTEKLISDVKRSVTKLIKINNIVKRAFKETNDPACKNRIFTQSWMNDYAILMAKGMLHHLKGEYHFAGIENITWRRKSRNRNSREGLEGRYIQVIKELNQSIKSYEDAVALVQALPEREQTVWGMTRLISYNKLACNTMRAKIAECEQYI